MSVNDVIAIASSYVGEARRFYEDADQYDLGGPRPPETDLLVWLEDRAEPLLAISEGVRSEAESSLTPIPRGEEYAQLCDAVLAAATLDAMFASDFALWDAELAGSPRELGDADRMEDWREYLEDEAPEPDPAELVEARQATLDSVEEMLGGAFAPAGGAVVDHRGASIELAGDVTSDLFGFAVTPTRKLLAGLMTAATGGAVDALAATAHISLVPGLETVAQSLRKRAAGFLREHVGKVEALHPDARVVADVAGRLRERMRAEELLDRVAGAGLADGIVTARIMAADQFAAQTAENLATDLRRLTGPFGRQSEVIGKSARWLRWGATPLTHLVAPIVGHAVVAGVYLTGIGYVAYALADRVDARDLGIADRVDGVVRIVEAWT
jgi:hypothetical protein